MSRTPSDPPADFTDPMKTRYRNLREMLRKQGTFQDMDARTLAALVRCEFMADDARSQLPLNAAGKPILVERGSRGQDVAHPLLKVIREAEQDAHRYATDLLMTPAARAGKDIKPPKGKGRLGL